MFSYTDTLVTNYLRNDNGGIKSNAQSVLKTRINGDFYANHDISVVYQQADFNCPSVSISALVTYLLSLTLTQVDTTPKCPDTPDC